MEEPPIAPQVPASPTHAPIGRATAAAILALILAFGLVVRIVPARDFVFPAEGPAAASGEARLLEADPYFHLRHARRIVETFPRIERWDAATQYPRGVFEMHVGLFDAAIAGGAALLAGGRPDDRALTRSAALLPVALGLLSILALYRLARAFGGRGAALLACALLSLCPGGFLGRSMLGEADHHVAEVLLTLLSLRGLARCLARSRGARPPTLLRPALQDALPLALFQFTWAGAPTLLLVLTLALVPLALVDLWRGRDLRPLAAALLRYGAGLLVVLVPTALLWSDLVMVPWVFPKVVLAAAGLALGAPLALLGLRALAARGVPGPVAAGLALGLLSLGLWAALALDQGALAGKLLTPQTGLVQENRPVTFALALGSLGTPGLLALLAVPLALVAAWRREEDASLLLPAATGALLALIWWSARDHDYVVPPLSALLAALLLERAAGALGARVRTPLAQAAAGLALVAALVVPIYPLRVVRAPWRSRDDVRALTLVNDGWLEALGWLARAAPAQGPGPREPAERFPGLDQDHPYPPGEVGVMAGWDFGHAIAALGRKPPVASHGPMSHDARWFLCQDEEESLRILDEGCRGGERVRFAIVDARSQADFLWARAVCAGVDPESLTERRPRAIPGRTVELPSLGPRYARSIGARLFDEDGFGLGRYRLVFESRHRSFAGWVAAPDLGDPPMAARQAFPLDTPREREIFEDVLQAARPVMVGPRLVYDGRISSSVKVFERVEGALLRGVTRPDAEVAASVVLRAGASGRALGYAPRARSDARGAFAFRVAHATRGGAPDLGVRAAGRYDVRAAGIDQPIAQIDVDEAQVVSGAVIDLGRRKGAPAED